MTDAQTHYTLRIVSKTGRGPMAARDLPARHSDLGHAMSAAKLAAGKDAKFSAVDRLGCYAGSNGTVFLHGHVSA